MNDKPMQALVPFPSDSDMGPMGTHADQFIIGSLKLRHLQKHDIKMMLNVLCWEVRQLAIIFICTSLFFYQYTFFCGEIYLKVIYIFNKKLHCIMILVPKKSKNLKILFQLRTKAHFSDLVEKSK